MTQLELETRLKNLEKQVMSLANRQTNRDNDNVASIQESNTEIQANKSNIEANIESIGTHNGALEMLMEDLLPEMQGQTTDLSDIIDQILTEIIPAMMGEE